MGEQSGGRSVCCIAVQLGTSDGQVDAGAVRLPCVLDTGASTSFISPSQLAQLRAALDTVIDDTPLSTPVTVATAAEGSSVTATESVQLPQLTVTSHEGAQHVISGAKFLVDPELRNREVLLGRNVFWQLGTPARARLPGTAFPAGPSHRGPRGHLVGRPGRVWPAMYHVGRIETLSQPHPPPPTPTCPCPATLPLVPVREAVCGLLAHMSCAVACGSVCGPGVMCPCVCVSIAVLPVPAHAVAWSPPQRCVPKRSAGQQPSVRQQGLVCSVCTQWARGNAFTRDLQGT